MPKIPKNAKCKSNCNAKVSTMHVCEQKFQEAWLSVKIPTYIKIAPGSALIFKRRSILTNVLHCRVTQTLNFPALEFPSATIIVIITITIIIMVIAIIDRFPSTYCRPSPSNILAGGNSTTAASCQEECDNTQGRPRVWRNSNVISNLVLLLVCLV